MVGVVVVGGVAKLLVRAPVGRCSLEASFASYLCLSSKRARSGQRARSISHFLFDRPARRVPGVDLRVAGADPVVAGVAFRGSRGPSYDARVPSDGTRVDCRVARVAPGLTWPACRAPRAALGVARARFPFAAGALRARNVVPDREEAALHRVGRVLRRRDRRFGLQRRPLRLRKLPSGRHGRRSRRQRRAPRLPERVPGGRRRFVGVRESLSGASDHLPRRSKRPLGCREPHQERRGRLLGRRHRFAGDRNLLLVLPRRLLCARRRLRRVPTRPPLRQHRVRSRQQCRLGRWTRRSSRPRKRPFPHPRGGTSRTARWKPWDRWHSRSGNNTGPRPARRDTRRRCRRSRCRPAGHRNRRSSQTSRGTPRGRCSRPSDRGTPRQPPQSQARPASAFDASPDDGAPEHDAVKPAG